MSEHPTSNEQRLSIKSMSAAGDSLYLFLDQHGSMHIGIEDGEGSHGAWFTREHQTQLRDWLTKVLPAHEPQPALNEVSFEQWAKRQAPHHSLARDQYGQYECSDTRWLELAWNAARATHEPCVIPDATRKLGELAAAHVLMRLALSKILHEGDFTAPEGMKRIARAALDSTASADALRAAQPPEAAQSCDDGLRAIECPSCHGVGGGVTRDGIEMDCSKCDGEGSIVVAAQPPLDAVSEAAIENALVYADYLKYESANSTVIKRLAAEVRRLRPAQPPCADRCAIEFTRDELSVALEAVAVSAGSPRWQARAAPVREKLSTAWDAKGWRATSTK